jgi:hypothetical protein
VGIALVPNLLNETPAERYENRMNDLLDFGDAWWGAYDQRALRIVLASCYGHLFTSDTPIWLWAIDSPRKLDSAIGLTLGRLLFCPTAEAIAEELSVKDKSLWVISQISGIFHRPPAEIESSLLQLADIERGDQRITVIATAKALDRLQLMRCGPLWPICQNTFVNVRMDGGKMSAELREKWMRFDPNEYRQADRHRVKYSQQSADEWVVSELRLRLINLMDFDFRSPNHEARIPPGFFDPLTYLATVVGALRGSGFDSELILSRGTHLACAHARMTGKTQCDSEDLQLSRKVLLDAIPPPSIEVLKAIPLEGYWTIQQVADASHTTPFRVDAIVSRLCGSGAVTGKRGQLVTAKNPKTQRWFRTEPELAQALMASGLENS